MNRKRILAAEIELQKSITLDPQHYCSFVATQKYHCDELKLMKINYWQVTFVWIIVFTATHLSVYAQSKLNSEISICSLPVSDSIKQANANFSISYSFFLNEQGVPTNMEVIKDGFVGKTSVYKCIQDWRINGLPPNTKIVFVFKWKHGMGWVELLVTGADFSQLLRIKDGIGY